MAESGTPSSLATAMAANAFAHVVGARQIQRHGQGTLRPGSSTRKRVPAARTLQHRGAHVHPLGESIRDERTADLWNQAAHVLIVTAQHRQTVEGQVVAGS